MLQIKKQCWLLFYLAIVRCGTFVLKSYYSRTLSELSYIKAIFLIICRILRVFLHKSDAEVHSKDFYLVSYYLTHYLAFFT